MDWEILNERVRSTAPDQVGLESTQRRRLFLMLKILVTGALVVWIVQRVDWKSFWQVLTTSDLRVVGLVLVLPWFGLLFSALKWQHLLRVHSAVYRLALLTRWYLVASFLNHFLPSSIGGDGFRLYKTWRNRRGRAAAVLAIIIERVTGLGALALLGSAAALVLAWRGEDPLAHHVLQLAAACLTLGLVAAVAVLVLGRWAWVKRSRIWRYVDVLLTLVRDVRHHPGRISLVVGLSLAFHLNKFLMIWLLLHALGGEVGALALMACLLIVELAGLLPISLGGLGLIEASFILVIGRYGVPEEIALATMLLLRVLMLPFYLAGGWFYFRGDDSRNEPMSNQSSDVYDDIWSVNAK